MVLDFTTPACENLMDVILRMTSEVLHASERHCALVLMSKRYYGQKWETVQKMNRFIEDRMYVHQMSPEIEVSVSYTIPDAPMTEKSRLLGQRAKLSTSLKHGGGPWEESHAARGKITDVPLPRVKDMRAPKAVGGLMDPAKLSPGDRNQQKSAVSAMHLIDTVVAGMDLKKADKFLVVHVSPELPGEFFRAVLQGQQEWSQHNGPYLGFLGIVIDDIVLHKTLADDIVTELLSGWWETCPEAAKYEASRDAGVDDKPSLDLLSWPSDGIPTCSDLMVQKFGDDSEYYSSWQESLRKARAMISDATSFLDIPSLRPETGGCN